MILKLRPGKPTFESTHNFSTYIVRSISHSKYQKENITYTFDIQSLENTIQIARTTTSETRGKGE